MPIHIRYNDYTPDIEDLEPYSKNISSPSKEDFNLYKEIVLDIITEISDKFDENDATDIKPSDREFISQAFSCNPKSHDLCQEPTIYIKSSTDVDGWENSFRYIVSYEIANQYLI